MSIKKSSLLLALTLSTIFGAGPAFANSEAFSHLSYKQAKEQAQKEGKILIVDFMATWCPPCKKMDSTTWVDSKVNEWVKQNAIAIQVDVDKDEETTSALNIDSMPTIVLFKPDGGGKEFTRESGYQSPEELLHWLNNVKSGKSTEKVKEETSQSGDGSAFERISKAHELLRGKKYAEAHDEYFWLWNNIDPNDSTLSELRKKLIPIEVRALLESFPEAKAKWMELRDSSEKENKRADWLCLNLMLNDNARTLAWFDKAKLDATQQKTIEELGTLLEYPLFMNKRYNDATMYLYPKPIEKIQAYHKAAEEIMKPSPDTEFAKGFDPFPAMVVMVYSAYLGAGKDGDAKKIYDECLRLDNTPAMKEMLENINKAMEKIKTAKSGSVAK